MSPPGTLDPRIRRAGLLLAILTGFTAPAWSETSPPPGSAAPATPAAAPATPAAAPATPAAAPATPAAAPATESPPPAPEDDFVYQAVNKRDPFRPPIDVIRQQSKVEESHVSPLPSAGPPQPQREKEPLESFPLESLKLSGVIHIRGIVVALVQDPSGRGHPVQPGMRLGQREGRVVRITSEGIELEEMYIDVGEESPKPHITLLPLHANKGESPQ